MESTTSTGLTHPYNPLSTGEQIDIYQWVKYGSGHAVIKARAGSGKTTTLTEICKLLPDNASKTFLAYNVHIKKELERKLPESVWCYTTHGLGFSAIKRKYKNIEVEPYKVDKLLQKYLKIWPTDQIPNLMVYESDMKKLIHLIRLSLTLNKKYIPDLCDKHDLKLDGEDISRAFKILEDMLNDKKTIDFTDMVYLPNVDPKIWFFPQDFILVDEAQDLSKAHLELIKKAAKKDKEGKYIGRMIFVGDDMQAIYGFSGSDAFSFANLLKLPNTTVFPLTTTFRCGKNIVKEANSIVLDIKAMENAVDGIVREGSAVDEAVAGDFILSRKTFPLVKMFFELLVQNKKAHIKGSDVGQSLIDYTKDKPSMAQLDASLSNKLADFRNKLASYGIMNYQEDMGYIALRDKIKILRFLMTMVTDIEDLQKRIQFIFRDDTENKSELDVNDGIILSTVHKAKGLEANRVFIIMPKDIPLRSSQPWQYAQEMNLKYIAITRARHELIYDREWTVDDGTFTDFTNN